LLKGHYFVNQRVIISLDKYTLRGYPGQKVSWMVTGIRQDAYAKAHPIPVEEDKSESEKGKYLHPEVFGQPEEMGIGPRATTAKAPV
jgi:hypothetical protein